MRDADSKTNSPVPALSGALARLVSVGLILVSFRAAAAEPVTLPAGSGPAPRLSATVKSGALVGAQQAHLYRAVLPTEVADILAQDDLAFEAATIDLPAPTREGAPGAVRVGAQGEIEGDVAKVSVHLFGVSVAEMAPLSAAEKGYRLLWNSESVLWREHSFSESLSVSVFTARNSLGERVQVNLARVYPTATGQESGATKTLFRERITFTTPSSLEGLGWLSIRVRGASDDYVWAASPLVKSVRQLSGGVRSEEIFPSGFAPNDLKVWSGKIESVEPKKVERLAMLIPVIQEVQQLSKLPGAGCFGLPRGRLRVQFNAESRRFPQLPGWIPTNVRFVPRWVWRIDLAAKDPFDADVVQSLFIDEESFLPVYRVSWGERGAVRKVALGVLGFLGYENTVRPWLLGELVRNVPGLSFVAVGTEALQLCTSPVSGMALSDFDPVALQARLDAFKRQEAKAPEVGREGLGPEAE